MRDETKTVSWEAYLKGVGTQVLIALPLCGISAHHRIDSFNSLTEITKTLKPLTTQELVLKTIPSQSRHFYPPLRSVPTACLFPKAIQVYFTCTLVLVQVYPCTSSFTVTFLRASSTDVTG